jgi:predicted nucleic acid-binding protein
MITAIDTNVLISLWTGDEDATLIARRALDAARSRGGLTICGPVYSELLAFPGRQTSLLENFLEDSSIEVGWEFDLEDWRAAGQAFQKSVSQRRKQSMEGPRRILADFMIGAHAARRSQSLLTFDKTFYSKAFPALKLVGAQQ